MEGRRRRHVLHIYKKTSHRTLEKIRASWLAMKMEEAKYTFFICYSSFSQPLNPADKTKLIAMKKRLGKRTELFFNWDIFEIF